MADASSSFGANSSSSLPKEEELGGKMKVLGDSANILLSVAVLVCMAFSPAYAITRNVCSACAYHSINEALEGAVDGTTIRVAAGSYEGAYIPSSANGRIEIIGGWKEDFSQHDPQLFTTYIGPVTVGYYAHADITLRHLDISGSSSQGVVVWSSASSLKIEQCNVHDNQSSGIYILTAKGAEVLNNTLYNNNLNSNLGISGYAGIEVMDSAHDSLTISGNQSSGSRCQYCYGIIIYNAKSSDVITRNIVTNNFAGGMSIRAYQPSSAYSVEWNVAHNNDGLGVLLQGGAPIAQHNLLHHNGGMGMQFSSPSGGRIAYNVFSRNLREGFSLIGSSSAAPQFVFANIFEGNDIGFNIAANTWGWGSTNLQPVSTNNIFWNNTRSEVVHSGRYPWGYESPIHGEYGSFNDIPGFSSNVVVNPNFVDADNGDYSLNPTSFGIDEGPSDLDASEEPAPNGNRINIGLLGGSASAELSPASPHIYELEAHFEGSDLVINFDTSQNSDYYWLDVSYHLNGNSVQVPATELTGDQIHQQFNRALLSSGLDRQVRWGNALGKLPDGISNLDIEVSLQHGNRSDTQSATAIRDCNLNASLDKGQFGEAGGLAHINIASECAWTISSSADWVSLEQNAGLGTSDIGVNIKANESHTARTASIQLGDQIFSISQAAAACENCGYTNAPEPSPPTVAPSPSPAPQAPTPEPSPPASLMFLTTPSSSGKIRVSPARSCGANCYQVQQSSGNITISVSARNGYQFKGLSGSVALPKSCNNKSGTCSIKYGTLSSRALQSQSAQIGRITLTANYSRKGKK
ncbi:MAG: right-handed parallel beta-helix repeat-containing protein [Oligoflexia bacterium]|nr:right-handed parallel beta-helix repeat-containing protein [Oligoflexia bacterium]